MCLRVVNLSAAVSLRMTQICRGQELHSRVSPYRRPCHKAVLLTEDVCHLQPAVILSLAVTLLQQLNMHDLPENNS